MIMLRLSEPLNLMWRQTETELYTNIIQELPNVALYSHDTVVILIR